MSDQPTSDQTRVLGFSYGMGMIHTHATHALRTAEKMAMSTLEQYEIDALISNLGKILAITSATGRALAEMRDDAMRARATT